MSTWMMNAASGPGVPAGGHRPLLLRGDARGLDRPRAVAGTAQQRIARLPDLLEHAADQDGRLPADHLRHPAVPVSPPGVEDRRRPACHQPEAQEGADHLVRLRQRDPPGGGRLARVGRRAHRDRRHHPERADACQEQARPARTQDRVHRGRRDRDDAEGRLCRRQRHVLPAARTAARPEGQGPERSRPHAGPRRQAVPGRIPQARRPGS